ncbi:MAG: hypothetical protein LUE98_01975 [Tannerellaceae bacterium]|nr:hypothetical protein [Tannerellaceae bacterium]
MCKHIYKHDFTDTPTCEWDKFYENIYENTLIKEISYPDLPHDKEGVCLFHSKDIDWKRKNHFVERLTELVYLLNNDSNPEENGDIALVDFIMVGNQKLEEAYPKHAYKIDFPDENIFYIKNTLCTSHLRIQHCRFIDPVVLERTIFKYDLILDNCLFKQSVSVENLTTGADLYMEQTVFKKYLVTDGINHVYSGLRILDSQFSSRTNFHGFKIQEFSVIDNCHFEKSDYVTNFYCYFDGGLDFSRNVFAHLCFDTCSFEGDCNFSELTQEYSWEILQPTILGQTAFIGTEDNMLFNSKTKIELTPDCFFELGHVTFDYCNIKDLGTAFVDSVKDLEDSGLVQVHPSCCVERLTVIYEYPYSAIKANIIEDFVHLITRYFRRWHSVNLSVNINRDRKNNRIKIVFKTIDDLSDVEFNRIMHKFSTTLQTTETNDPEIVDIQKTYRNIIERINDSNALTPENKWEILSLQGNIYININTLSIMEKRD